MHRYTDCCSCFSDDTSSALCCDRFSYTFTLYTHSVTCTHADALRYACAAIITFVCVMMHARLCEWMFSCMLACKHVYMYAYMFVCVCMSKSTHTLAQIQHFCCEKEKILSFYLGFSTTRAEHIPKKSWWVPSQTSGGPHARGGGQRHRAKSPQLDKDCARAVLTDGAWIDEVDALTGVPPVAFGVHISIRNLYSPTAQCEYTALCTLYRYAGLDLTW